MALESFGTLENTKKASDLVKWEVDMRFCRAVGTYTNGSGDPVIIADPVGVPVVFTQTGNGVGTITLVETADEAEANAVIIDNRGKTTIADEGVQEFICLVRGPALINEGALAVADVEGEVLIAADLVEALRASGIEALDEASPTGEQTT